MISPTNGEVVFADGLIIRPHALLKTLSVQAKRLDSSPLGWTGFDAGRHPSEHGEFAVELACTTAEMAVFLVILWSVEPFFEVGSEEDHERAAFHDAVLAKDLRGQREFSWGEVFSKYHPRDARNCLNVVYTPGPKVPRVPRVKLGWLAERLAP